MLNPPPAEAEGFPPQSPPFFPSVQTLRWTLFNVTVLFQGHWGWCGGGAGLDSVVCWSLWLHETSIRVESVCTVSYSWGDQMALKWRFANRSSSCCVFQLLTEKWCCVAAVYSFILVSFYCFKRQKVWNAAKTWLWQKNKKIIMVCLMLAGYF